MNTLEKDLQILEYIKRDAGNAEISEALDVTRDSIRRTIDRLRKTGHHVPRRSPDGVIRKRLGIPTCVLNSYLLDLQRDLASIQTGKPEDHLEALRKRPLYQDVRFRSVG